MSAHSGVQSMVDAEASGAVMRWVIHFQHCTTCTMRYTVEHNSPIIDRRSPCPAVYICDVKASELLRIWLQVNGIQTLRWYQTRYAHANIPASLQVLSHPGALSHSGVLSHPGVLTSCRFRIDFKAFYLPSTCMWLAETDSLELMPGKVAVKY